jgi:hypothetical protein
MLHKINININVGKHCLALVIGFIRSPNSGGNWLRAEYAAA